MKNQNLIVVCRAHLKKPGDQPSWAAFRARSLSPCLLPLSQSYHLKDLSLLPLPFPRRQRLSRCHLLHSRPHASPHVMGTSLPFQRYLQLATPSLAPRSLRPFHARLVRDGGLAMPVLVSRLLFPFPWVSPPVSLWGLTTPSFSSALCPALSQSIGRGFLRPYVPPLLSLHRMSGSFGTAPASSSPRPPPCLPLFLA